MRIYLRTRGIFHGICNRCESSNRGLKHWRFWGMHLGIRASDAPPPIWFQFTPLRFTYGTKWNFSLVAKPGRKDERRRTLITGWVGWPVSHWLTDWMPQWMNEWVKVLLIRGLFAHRRPLGTHHYNRCTGRNRWFYHNQFFTHYTLLQINQTFFTFVHILNGHFTQMSGIKNLLEKSLP